MAAPILTFGRFIHQGTRSEPAALAGDDEARVVILASGQVRPVLMRRQAGYPNIAPLYPDDARATEGPHERATRHARPWKVF